MTEALSSNNPFATPETDATPVQIQSEHDQFIINEVEPMLRPGERILYTAFLIKAPPLWVQILFGGLILLFFYKYFLAAVTNQRIVLLRTKQTWMKPKLLHLETDEIQWDGVERVDIGGFANNKSLKFKFRDGTDRTLRIGPWAKFVSGQKAFFESMQNFNTKRLSA